MPDAALRERLDEGLARLGGPAAALDDAVRERLVRFVRLLEKWNRVHNLTAVRDAHAMIGRHLLDSLALLPWLPEPESASSSEPVPESELDLLDIGSGAGLPVLPLALARPDLRCLSVDAVGKKVRFQHQAVLELGTANVEARHARIEDVAVRARTVVSRAFAAPADFLVAAAPRCADGGTALVMLGRRERLPDTLPEPFVLGEVRALDVPFGDGARHVAVCHASPAAGSTPVSRSASGSIAEPVPDPATGSMSGSCPIDYTRTS